MATISLAALCDAIRPGERVFVSGAAGEPVGFMEELLAQPERTRDLDLWSSFVPGINPVAIGRFDLSARVTSLFMQPGLDEALAEDRFRHLPLAYSGFGRLLRAGPAIDTLVVQVAPPDGTGRCSLGPHAEFLPVMLQRARRILAVVNPNVPHIPNAPTIDFADAALVAEDDSLLRHYGAGRSDPVSDAIASLVAGYVADGSTLQVGIGKVPTALLALLADRRNLRLHSGIITPGVRTLIDAGAIDAGPGALTACALLGDADFYKWCVDRGDLDVRGCEITHDAVRLGALGRFVAVNSALQVDLLGQASLETIDGRGVSGAGGAPDFAQAASANQDGISIVALPASTSRGQSRIVARLAPGAPVGIARQHVDIIVTEHGAADLRGRSSRERAIAIASIAAAADREQLLQASGLGAEHA